jgi:hypothetical protein
MKDAYSFLHAFGHESISNNKHIQQLFFDTCQLAEEKYVRQHFINSDFYWMNMVHFPGKEQVFFGNVFNDDFVMLYDNQLSKKSTLQQKFFHDYICEKIMQNKNKMVLPIKLYQQIDDIYFIQDNFVADKYSDRQLEEYILSEKPSFQIFQMIIEHFMRKGLIDVICQKYGHIPEVVQILMMLRQEKTVMQKLLPKIFETDNTIHKTKTIKFMLDQCCICMAHDQAQHIIILNCNHVFHVECLFKCEKKECPTCKTEFSYPQQINLDALIL